MTKNLLEKAQKALASARLLLAADYLAEPVTLDKAQWAIDEAESFVSGVRRLLTQQTLR